MTNKKISRLMKKLFMILISDYYQKQNMIAYNKKDWTMILETSHMLLQHIHNPIIALYAGLYIVSGLVCQVPDDDVLTLKDFERISNFSAGINVGFAENRLGCEFLDFVLCRDELKDLRQVAVMGAIDGRLGKKIRAYLFNS